MKQRLKITEPDVGKAVYLSDGGQAVSVAMLGEGLDVVSNILWACREHMDDFLEIHCGNGEYDGHFMLVKLGLERAMSITGGLRPDANS